MNAVLTVTLDGKTKKFSCIEGQTLREALLANGVALPSPCGGRGVCGKCRLQAEGALLAPDEAERATLGGAIAKGVRLACRARIAGNCTVKIEKDRHFNIAAGSAALPERRDPMYTDWGAAVDIGTTTVTVQLYHADGLAGSLSERNPQGAFGADVISRIGASLEGKGPALQTAIVQCIEAMICTLAGRQNIKPGRIDAMAVTGNTTMLYLLTGKDPQALSHAPFEADCLFGEYADSRSLGFSFPARCFLPRCMEAFVGADITTAILASGMLQHKETALLVDVGTNGEMALWHNGRLTCCSTAAGPAFEGAEIECGCHGIYGAIDRVGIANGAIHCSTIGDADAVGICGSGLVDAVTQLLTLGIIDESGMITKPDMQVESGPAVRLSGDVYISQRDVRNMQLAKSAICAGTLTLLSEAGLDPNDVETFYIAGGFGSFLNVRSAAAIGLFPHVLADRSRVIGNAAVAGAAMLLQNKGLVQMTTAFANAAEHIELSTHSLFMEKYVEGMLF